MDKIEITLNIFIPTPDPQRVSIPIDMGRCNNIQEVEQFLKRNSTDMIKMWLTGQLPMTSENIQIEKDQENKLQNKK